MKCATPLYEAMVVVSVYKKTQIGYTQYVDNDVYVDDMFTFCTAKAMDGSYEKQYANLWQEARFFGNSNLSLLSLSVCICLSLSLCHQFPSLSL